jgi:hypothetical protein
MTYLMQYQVTSDDTSDDQLNNAVASGAGARRSLHTAPHQVASCCYKLLGSYHSHGMQMTSRLSKRSQKYGCRLMAACSWPAV